MDIVVLYEIQSRYRDEEQQGSKPWAILDSDQNKVDILEAWEAYGFGNPENFSEIDHAFEYRICKVIKINEVIVGEGAE